VQFVHFPDKVSDFVLSKSRKHQLLNSGGMCVILPQFDEAPWSKPTPLREPTISFCCCAAVRAEGCGLTYRGTEITGWTGARTSVMLSATMIPTNAAIFGLVVAAVLACLALDRALAKRRQARIKK
jgi:hypothetical protein